MSLFRKEKGKPENYFENIVKIKELLEKTEETSYKEIAELLKLDEKTVKDAIGAKFKEMVGSVGQILDFSKNPNDDFYLFGKVKEINNDKNYQRFINLLTYNVKGQGKLLDASLRMR